MHRYSEGITRRKALVATAVSAVGTVPLISSQSAFAAKPVTPVGDDIGFLQLGALVELLCVSAYRAAARHEGFSPSQVRWLDEARTADQKHYDLLTPALGSDAPKFGDYKLNFGAKTLSSKTRLLGLLDELERISTGLYISAVGNTTDPGTGELFGRLIAADTQHLTSLRRIEGRSPYTGALPPAIDLDTAGDRVDSYISDLYPDQ